MTKMLLRDIKIALLVISRRWHCRHHIGLPILIGYACVTSHVRRNISFEIRKSTIPNTHNYHLKQHKFSLKTSASAGEDSSGPGRQSLHRTLRLTRHTHTPKKLPRRQGDAIQAVSI